MPFPKFDPNALPRRYWALVGYPESGKSTFLTQMRSPLLVTGEDMGYRVVQHGIV